jgi:hypothetical protein
VSNTWNSGGFGLSWGDIRILRSMVGCPAMSWHEKTSRVDRRLRALNSAQRANK